MRTRAVAAAILAALLLPVALGVPATFESHADLSEALVNLVEMRQENAGTGHQAAANCQLIVAANVFVGAVSVADALQVIDDNDTLNVTQIGALRRIDFSQENATSTCSHEIGTISMRIERDPGWGARPEEATAFWGREPKPRLLENENITFNATAVIGEIAANNATILMGAGIGHAAASCQLIVAADVVLASLAFARQQNATTMEVPTLQQPGPAQGKADASCRQNVVLASIVVPDAD